MKISLGGGRAVEVHSTDRSNGDFAIDSAGVAERRGQILPTPWTWLRLVHGARVVSVEQAGQWAGQFADGACTATFGSPLAVTSADCAPVVLAAADDDRAVLGVVHAGWRGLVAGIVEEAAEVLNACVGPDAQKVAYCGPCIGPADYEFSPMDLVRLTAQFGPSVRSETDAGQPALDLFAGIAVALERSGFPVPDRPETTALSKYFSHRVRADPERMTTVAQLVSGQIQGER